MKSTALSGWVLGLGLLAACGSGAEGARGLETGGSAGSGAVAMSGGSQNLGMGGTVTASGNSMGGAVTEAGTGGAPPKVCGPAWMAGMTYPAGAIVSFGGSYYIAEHENPGYDPVISTYFWNPYACDDGGSGGTSSVGGSGNKPPVGESSFDDVVSEELFNEIFPRRDAFYTYQGLVEATKYYPGFAGTGTTDDRKREAAAFLANVARETGELIYIEQIAKEDYCEPRANCECQPGRQYFGRGPIQISWNYNYCLAGAALGLDLRGNPDLVAQDATVAWETGLWFWMTQSGAGARTPHDNITGQHGFGETIRSINGGQECNGKWAEAVQARVQFFQRFCQVLGVTPGENQEC